MESDSLHDTTVSIVDGDPGGSIESSPNNGAILANKDVMREIGNDLMRLGMYLACCSEKLVNMDLLMMYVAAKESDFEAFTVEKEEKLDSSAVAALEFDILSGFFDLEVKEMYNFIGKLKVKFKNSSDAISAYKHMEIGFSQFEEKLLDAEKSLKQSEEHVKELMTQSAKFQRIVLRANRGESWDEDRDMGVEESGDFFSSTTKLQMQTPEQQRHILKMLEKSMARELDLENQLTECMQTIDKMNRKLYYSQRELVSVEEETAGVYARFLEADNASAVLLGISKELIGQLQSCQLNINSALCRESELNTKFENCMQTIQKLEKEEALTQELAEKASIEATVLKEKVNCLEEQLKASEFALLNGSISLNDDMQQEIKALEEKVAIAESRAEKAEAEVKLLSVTNKELIEEIDLLKRSGISCEKIESLEEQLREKDFQLQQAMVSIEASQEKQSMYCTSIEDMEFVIDQLKTNLLSAESRAEILESEYRLLAEANKQLNMELDLVKSSSISSEKVVVLENKLRETDIQLQEAAASVEASQEKQTMLISTINDMEVLIEKLKSNVLKADARADSAEDKCIILSESHAELNEDLIFLRGKVGRLEATLQQTEEKKLAAAKDINTRTKVISDLVMQLAVERERLQKQKSWLMENNRGSNYKSQMAARGSMNHSTRETVDGVLSSGHRVHSFDTGIHDSDIPDTSEVHRSAEDASNGESNLETLEDPKFKLETVRTIDAGRLNLRHVSAAILIAFAAVLATCFLSPENCPF